MKLGVLLLGVLFLLGVNTANAQLVASQESNHWATTGLNSNDLVQFLSTEKCYENKTSFYACIQAINTVLSYSKKTLSNKKIETMEGMGDVSFVLERLQIREFTLDNNKNDDLDEAKGKTFMVYWSGFKAQEKQIRESWESVFVLTKETPLSMETLTKKALSFVDAIRTPMIIGESINTYYKITVDPHTYIVPLAEQTENMSKSDNNYVGIGAYIKKIGKKVLLSPIEDSPALKAGIRSNDVLIAVDDELINSLNINQVTDKLKGENKTPVKVTIRRGEDTLEIIIIRGPIERPNMSFKLLIDPSTQSKVGYIKLNSFIEEGICQKFLNFTVRLYEMGATSLILDVRNNGGGLLKEALCMAGTYTDNKELLLTERDPETNNILSEYFTKDDVILKRDQNFLSFFLPQGFAPTKTSLLYKVFQKPLVILVNQGSASASELLPGVLQDQKRALVVGVRSFGKGTVQGGGLWKDGPKVAQKTTLLYKTQSRFHFASGRSNQLVGITPDFEAFNTPNPTEEDKFALREGDYYDNAIAPKEQPFERDEALIKKTKSCVELNKEALLKEYEEGLAHAALEPDYQLLYARGVATCL